LEFVPNVILRLPAKSFKQVLALFEELVLELSEEWDSVQVPVLVLELVQARD
jgi:hypothetical protein